MNEVAELYKKKNNTDKLPVSKMTEAEIAASKKIPSNHAVLDTYFSKRVQYVPGTALHPTMATELLNFVDGKRSYLDIYINGRFCQETIENALTYTYPCPSNHLPFTLNMQKKDTCRARPSMVFR